MNYGQVSLKIIPEYNNFIRLNTSGSKFLHKIHKIHNIKRCIITQIFPRGNESGDKGLKAKQKTPFAESLLKSNTRTLIYSIFLFKKTPFSFQMSLKLFHCMRHLV